MIRTWGYPSSGDMALWLVEGDQPEGPIQYGEYFVMITPNVDRFRETPICGFVEEAEYCPENWIIAY